MMMLLDKKEPVLIFDKAFTINTLFAHAVENHGKKIVATVVLILIFSLFGVRELVVENSFINYFKKSPASLWHVRIQPPWTLAEQCKLAARGH